MSASSNLSPTPVRHEQTRSAMGGTRGLGFEPLTEEVRVERLDVSGTIPTWLSGTFVRATPARWEVGAKTLTHWFDGMAMLNAFSFRNGEVGYANSFVDSEIERAARRDQLRQTVSVGEIRRAGTDPCRRLGKRVMSFLDIDEPPLTTNINVARLGRKYLALTEFPIAIEFDPDTLETKSILDVRQGRTEVHAPMAHSHYEGGSMITAVTRVGLRNQLQLIAVDGETYQRRNIATIPAPRRPRYMHSFTITEHFAVFTLTPMEMRLGKIFTTGSFLDAWHYNAELGSQFVVIDRRTGELEGIYETDPFQVFHHINAFERDGELLVDLVVIDPTHMWALDMDVLRQSDHMHRFYGVAYRYCMTLNGGGRAVGKQISDEQIEFPTVNYAAYNGRPYRYTYAIGYERNDSDWFDEIVKVDVDTGGVLRWSEPGHYPSEPIAVSIPDGIAEDDCVVLSIVLDSYSGRSYLLVLDARTLEEIGRATVPHHIPFNFHQMYFD